MKIIQEWESMQAAAQLDHLKRCVLRSASAQLDGADCSGFLLFHGVDDLAIAGWLILRDRLNREYLEKLNRRRSTPITLSTLVYRAAKDAVRQAVCGDHLDKRMQFPDDQDEDYQFPSNMEPLEEQTVTHVLYAAFRDKCDSIDQTILDDSIKGLTGREIADHIGITSAAISKRKKRLIRQYHDAIEGRD